MKQLLILFIMVFLLGCATQQTLTPEQVAKQQQVDNIVATALFEAGLDNQASYKVSPDGEVNILFTPTVLESKYPHVLSVLRRDSRISKLVAEQDGKQICPL